MKPEMRPGGKKNKTKKRKKRKWVFPLILLGLVLAAAWLFFRLPPPAEKKVVQRMPAPPLPAPEKPGEAKAEKEKAEGKKEAKPGPALPRRGRLALIIDDGGYSVEKIRGMLGSGRPMTFAILPNTPFARKVALAVHEQGGQILLHLPMEPKESERYSLEKDTLLTGMSKKEIEEILRKDLLQIPHVRGVNNHMGSKATEDPELMRGMMDVLKKEGLFFIDSHTSSRTASRLAAREAGVRYGSNNGFMDHDKTLESIKASIRTAMKKAARDGRAIAIGHPHPLTAQAIREMIPEIEGAGIQLVFASEVVG